jgi:dimethylargininase
MTGELRRVLVRAPRAQELHGWRACGWRAEPDPAGIAREHEALSRILEDAGAEVVLAESPADGNPDAIYTFDPVLVSDEGALLLNPGKECRREEPGALAEDLERSGVPVVAQLESEERAEGGDLIRLDERTLLSGRGYRTNDEGIEALRRLVPGSR